MDLNKLRKNYPITYNGVFLNHAATSPVSHGTVEKMKEINDKMTEPLSKHFYQWLGVAETLRRKLAELIGAHPSEIAFTQNTSTALSILANAVDFKPGDKVLVPSDEFPSNIYAWQNLAQKGVECILFDPKPGEPITITLAKQNLSKVKLISISAVSYKTGRCYELEDFAHFCKERNILSCLDAIQAIGAIPLDIKKIGADFLASGGQKWLLGPIGCGFFYARKELLKGLHVPFVGWTSVKYPERFETNLDFADEMTRFEPGLPNILPVVGLEHSLNELEKIGFPFIYEQIKQHSLYLQNALSDLQLPLLTDKNDLTAGIVSFRIPHEVDKLAFSEAMEKKQILATIREDYMRLSPHFYTERSELDEFLNLLENVVKRKKTSKKSEEIKELISTPLSKKENPWAILTGATGILGCKMAPLLLQRGYNLLLQGRRPERLQALKEELIKIAPKNIQITTFAADYTIPEQMDAFLSHAQENKNGYDLVINCAGIAFAEPVASTDEDALKEIFQINVMAPMKLTKAFVTTLKSSDAKGILNIVPTAARCGFPLLSGYGGSMGAWWTMSESLDRELRKDGLWVTTYVAPAMHSRIQKQLGRVSLRYFKLSGIFDYAHAQNVAKEALDAFFNKKATVISKSNRLNLFLNLWWPNIITRKIVKIWRP